MSFNFRVFLLIFFRPKDPSQQCDYYVATGGKATLPMTFALDQSDELTWMHGMKTILRQTKDKFTSEGRNIVTANGSLTWANVAQSNAGAYKAEVHDRDGKSRWTSKSTRLCVIGRLQLKNKNRKHEKLVLRCIMSPMSSPQTPSPSPR